MPETTILQMDGQQPVQPEQNNWKQWAKVGAVFAVTTGACLIAKSTGAFSWVSSWMQKTEDGQNDALAVADENENPLAQFDQPLADRDEEIPEILSPDVLKEQGANGLRLAEFTELEINNGNRGVQTSTFNSHKVSRTYPTTDEFEVNTYKDGIQIEPAVAALTNGGFVVTWTTEGQADVGQDIHAQLFDSDGNMVGNEFMVNTYTTDNQAASSVIGLQNGEFVVVWGSGGQDGDATGSYGQRFAANGAKINSEFHISTYTLKSQYEPDIAELTDGSFMVVWTSYNGASYKHVYGQHYTSDCVKIDSEFRINQDMSNHRTRPFITELHNGNFVAVWWSSGGQDGDGAGIFGQIFAADGTRIWSEFQVNTYTISAQSFPSIDTLSNGGFIVTWASSEQDSSPGCGVYGQRYDDNCTRVGVEFRVNTNTLYDQYVNSVSGLPNGEFFVAWESTHTGDGYDIFGQHFGSDGSKVGGEFLISIKGAGWQRHPTVTTLNNGKFVVVWENYLQKDDTQGINAKIFSPQEISPTFGNNQLTVNKGQTVILNSNMLSATDLDLDDSDADLLFIIDNVQYGQFEEVVNPGAEITQFIQQQIIDGEIQFVHNNSSSVPTCSISVSDGSLATASTSTTITFSLTNNPPVLVDNSLIVSKGGTTFLTSDALSSTDIDNDDSGLIFIASNILRGQFGEELTNYSIPITQFMQQQVIDGQIQFIHDNSAIAPSYDIAVSDSTLTTTPVAADIDFSNIVIVTDEFQINTYTINGQWEQSVAALSNGDFVVAWQSNGQDGSNYSIYAQRFSANGTRVGQEFKVNTYTADQQKRPAVAGLTNDRFLITWDSSPDQDGSESGVYGQLYDNDGTEINSEFRINTYTTMYQAIPAITKLAGGRFIVVWESYEQDGSHYGTYGQCYDANGSTSGLEFQINTYTQGAQVFYSVSDLSNDEFVVVWESGSSQDGSYSGIYAQRFASDCTKIGTEFLVNTYTESYQSLPSVAGSPNGEFIVTWESYGQDGPDYEIYAQRYFNNGTRIGEEFQVSQINRPLQRFSVISVNLDGEFLISWQAWYDDLMGEVYGQYFTKDDKRIGSEFSINDYTLDRQTAPALVVLSDNNFIVTWCSYNQPNDGDNYGVFGKILHLNRAPKFTGNSLTVDEGQTMFVTNIDFSATDVDDDNALLNFNISNLSGGNFELESSPSNWTVTTQFTQQQVIDNQVRFVDDGNSTAPSYDVSVNDGDLSTASMPAIITFISMPTTTLAPTTTVTPTTTLTPTTTVAPTTATSTTILTPTTIASATTTTLAPSTVAPTTILTPTTTLAPMTTVSPTTVISTTTVPVTTITLPQTTTMSPTTTGIPTTMSSSSTAVISSSLSSSSSSSSVIHVNHAPFVNTTIQNQKAKLNHVFTFQVSDDTFVDPDRDMITYSATGNGVPLPSWLLFYNNTRTFSGTPNSLGKHDIIVIGTDEHGANEQTDFSIIVNRGLSPLSVAGIVVGSIVVPVLSFVVGGCLFYRKVQRDKIKKGYSLKEIKESYESSISSKSKPT